MKNLIFSLYGLLIIITFLTILITGCIADETSIPDRDIVFQNFTSSKKTVGLINSDGTGYIDIQMGFEATQPSLSSDGKVLISREAIGWPGTTISYPGYIHYFKEGSKPKMCKGFIADSLIQPINKSEDLLFSNGKQIAFLQVTSCRMSKILLEVHNNDLIHNQLFIGGSISQDKMVLAYSEYSNNKDGNNYSIRLFNIRTGVYQDLFQGINPAISPDGTKIAYLWTDGIYTANLDGTDIKRIVTYYPIDPSTGSFDHTPPFPSWSPDAKWLIYHKCNDKPKGSCDVISNFSIYKVDLTSGNETKLIDEGAYPYWKK